MFFPSLNKFLDPFRSSVNEERGSRDFFVMRLAETELSRPRRCCATGGPAEGLDHMNRVRRRAAIPGHETENGLTVGQLTLDEILNERARGAAGRGLWWARSWSRGPGSDRAARSSVTCWRDQNPQTRSTAQRTTIPRQNPGSLVQISSRVS